MGAQIEHMGQPQIGNPRQIRLVRCGMLAGTPQQAAFQPATASDSIAAIIPKIMHTFGGQNAIRKLGHMASD